MISNHEYYFSDATPAATATAVRGAPRGDDALYRTGRLVRVGEGGRGTLISYQSAAISDSLVAPPVQSHAQRTPRVFRAFFRGILQQ